MQSSGFRPDFAFPENPPTFPRVSGD